MRRALVTGAAGFIGSHLSARLLREGFDVLGIDSFSPHYDRSLKELNIAPLACERHFELVEADLALADLRELVDDMDVVFHLAARPGVRDSWSAFDDYVHANIKATQSLFDACALAGTRVVFASSSSVYGDVSELPVTEAAALRPISPYGATKVMAEVLAGAYTASFGLEAIGLRYFTVYGPRQRPDMGLSRFIEAWNAGEPIHVFGDGRQQRDMTYVDDAVAATIAAAEHGQPGKAYNVASCSPRSLLDVLRELGEILGLDLRLEYETRKAGDVRDTWGSIELGRSELGYEPMTPLRVGLSKQVTEAARRRAALAVL